MDKPVLSKSNPYLRDASRARRDLARSIATSTAIETGEDAAAIERRIMAGYRPVRHVELAGPAPSSASDR
jgi:hypothetical protein